MHARAFPTVARPKIRGLQLSRSGRRLLARAGMVHAQETTLASQAASIIARTWEWMSNHQVALWIDGYRHARRSLDPARVDITPDCTAIAIVTISKPPQLPTYGGHPVLRTLPSKVGTTAAEVVVRLQRLRQFIEILTESPSERTMIGVPQDVMRPDATTQRWQPLMLSVQKPGTFAELLDVCAMLGTLQRHTGNTLTILPDMKIHHALMRFLYGGGYVTRNFYRYLKSLPQVYGIWHPYKYTLTLLYRQHLPIIANNRDFSSAAP